MSPEGNQEGCLTTTRLLPLYQGLWKAPTTGVSIPLLCLEGVPDLPSTPKDEAGLTRKFET